MLICKFCGKEFERKSNFNKEPQWCSKQCHWKWYYQQNKEKKSSYSKERYVPHPKPKRTPEEIALSEKQQRERRLKYYRDHKDYYKQKNREWYQNHKNDEKVRERQRESMRRYYYRKKLKERSSNNEN